MLDSSFYFHLPPHTESKNLTLLIQTLLCQRNSYLFYIQKGEKNKRLLPQALTLFFLAQDHLKFFFLFVFNKLVSIFWLHQVSTAVHGLSLLEVSGGYSSSQCTDCSLWWPLLLWRVGSRHAGSGVVVHRLSCFEA